MSLTPTQRATRSRIASLSRWSQTAPAERPQATLPGRTAFLGQFEAAPDPESARKLYFTRLAFSSAKARAARASNKSAASAQTAEAAQSDLGGSISAAATAL